MSPSVPSPLPGEIRLGDHVIGRGHPCFLVAEIGINHNGDMGLARTMMEAAKAAGADAVKFQNYRTEDFLRSRDLTLTYQSQGRIITEPQYDLFKRCELGRTQLADLAEHARRIGILFFSTPTNSDGIDDLLAAGAPVLKNGSDYLTHLPLVEAMGRSGLPTILSTGMSTLAEIEDAVEAFRRGGGRDLVVLHCVSAYPAPLDGVDLRRMQRLGAALDCLVGFSDHTDGSVAALGAVALGAVMIEKHFTTDRGLPGPDHWFSETPDSFAALVRDVRGLEAALSVPAVSPDSQFKPSFRLSCQAAADLPAGHLLMQADIGFGRPGTGLPPKAADWITGLRLTRAVPAGHVFTPEDFA